jgi:DNA polymerase III epsilon subunit-like protein
MRSSIRSATFRRTRQEFTAIPEDAARVHGHTSAALRDKPIFSEVVGELLAFIGF